MNELEIAEITRSKLLIPAGKCPFQLEDSSYESTLIWIKKIKKNFGEKFDCKATVFRYWARMQFGSDVESFEEVERNINEITNSSYSIYDYMTGVAN